MINYIWAIMMIAAVITAFLTGRVEAVSNAAIQGAKTAVELVIGLIGAICFWNGMMKIAEKAGALDQFSKMLSPVLKLLFPKLEKGNPALKAISMNITANILGLGNAATPFGLAAMKELDRINKNKRVASAAMAMFVVINTASLQILPTTLMAMRAAAGSKNPGSIIPAIWCTSAISLVTGIIMSKMLEKCWKT